MRNGVVKGIRLPAEWIKNLPLAADDYQRGMDASRYIRMLLHKDDPKRFKLEELI